MKNIKLLPQLLKMRLDGKKTYVVGALMVALGLLNADQQMTLEGLSILFLRNALTKI